MNVTDIAFMIMIMIMTRIMTLVKYNTKDMTINSISSYYIIINMSYVRIL